MNIEYIYKVHWTKRVDQCPDCKMKFLKQEPDQVYCKSCLVEQEEEEQDDYYDNQLEIQRAYEEGIKDIMYY